MAGLGLVEEGLQACPADALDRRELALRRTTFPISDAVPSIA
jgi:hypothetical protein